MGWYSQCPGCSIVQPSGARAYRACVLEGAPSAPRLSVTILLQSEIDFLSRAMRLYGTETLLPIEAVIICLYADATEIDLASTMGIEVYLPLTLPFLSICLICPLTVQQRSNRLCRIARVLQRLR